MICLSTPLRGFTVPRRAMGRAFTLIELLVVMAIMLVLAGLILSAAGNVNYKSLVSRAKSEVHQMSTAMESYKVDNGAYPREAADKGAHTDALNAQTDKDPSVAAYKDASKFLFTALSGVVPAGSDRSKAYVTFLPGQLSPANTTPVAGTTYITDPFGFSYGYSTVYQSVQEKVADGTSTADKLAKAGFNPGFDLWSTAGYGTGGKGYPAELQSANTEYTLWVKY